MARRRCNGACTQAPLPLEASHSHRACASLRLLLRPSQDWLHQRPPPSEAPLVLIANQGEHRGTPYGVPVSPEAE